MEEEPYRLRLLHEYILEVYNEIVKICEKHGLCHYAYGGTALGAVRHCGFIPWDDDFDIAMPRPDYERFIKIALSELPAHLKFVNWKNTPEFSYLFGKVQDTRHDRVSAVERELGHPLTYGIFVDIFPIDGYPIGRISKFLTKLIAFAISEAGGRSPMRNRPRWKLALSERLLLAFKYDRSKYTGYSDLALSVFGHRPVEKRVWGKPCVVPFERISVPLPEQYDIYLKEEYNDYMTLPPVEKRRPTHYEDFECAWRFGPTTNRKPC